MDLDWLTEFQGIKNAYRTGFDRENEVIWTILLVGWPTVGLTFINHIHIT